MADPGVEEKFALSQIFAGNEEFSAFVRKMLPEIVIESRTETALGFRSMIRFPEELPNILSMPEGDWAFRHRKMSHGGGFFCTYYGPQHLLLQAMSFYGDWPSEFIPTDFEKKT